MGNPTRVRIDIPKGFSSDTLKKMGDAIITFIIDRSARGLDKNNVKFPKYEKEYAEEKGTSRGNVDVIMTGEMLDELKVLAVGKTWIEIGYDRRTNVSDKAEGNILGTYGQDSPIPGKARDFLGISDGDLEDVISYFEPDPEEVEASLELDPFGVIARGLPPEEYSTIYREMMARRT